MPQHSSQHSSLEGGECQNLHYILITGEHRILYYYLQPVSQTEGLNTELHS